MEIKNKAEKEYGCIKKRIFFLHIVSRLLAVRSFITKPDFSELSIKQMPKIPIATKASQNAEAFTELIKDKYHSELTIGTIYKAMHSLFTFSMVASILLFLLTFLLKLGIVVLLHLMFQEMLRS